MAKVSSPIVSDDFELDLGFATIPAAVLRELAPIDCTGSGVILSDSSIKVRLSRDGGLPVEYTVNVSVKRSPLDADETRRIGIAKEVQAAKKADRDAKQAEMITRISERAKADGRETASKEADGFKSGLTQAVTMLPALSEMARAMSSAAASKPNGHVAD